MKAQLMLTCLCDAFYGEVGIATAQVLEHCGIEVVFPEGQTCCGQPPFNAGDWDAARNLSKRCRAQFDPQIPVVIPSGSCTAMIRHGNHLLGIAESNSKVYELSEFLLDVLDISQWPLRGNLVARKRCVALHESCHGRMIQLGDRQRRVVAMVPGVELIDIEQSEQCCGFGGSFSATHGHLSEGIGSEKLRCLSEARADVIVSGDMGCLMHLSTLAAKRGEPVRAMHYAQLLSEALE